MLLAVHCLRSSARVHRIPSSSMTHLHGVSLPSRVARRSQQPVQHEWTKSRTMSTSSITKTGKNLSWCGEKSALCLLESKTAMDDRCCCFDSGADGRSGLHSCKPIDHRAAKKHWGQRIKHGLDVSVWLSKHFFL